MTFADRQRTGGRDREAPSTFEDLDGEVWKEIPSMVAYEVSNRGRVRSWRSRHGHRRKVPRLRKLVPTQHGRLSVMYVDEMKLLRLRLVHQLVLEAFVGPRPDGWVTRHLDNNPLNNALENLRWGTQLENMADKLTHGTALFGEKNHNCKLTSEQVIAIRASDEKGSVLAARYGVVDSAISRIRTGKRRSNG